MNGLIICIVILWSLYGFNLVIESAPYCKDLSCRKRLFICSLFLIGGPIFAFTGILEAVIRCMLPDDWNNDEDDKIWKT